MPEDIDKILQGLSQEERLKLLERLIKGAEEAREESLTVEDRLARLEELVLGGPWRGPRPRFRHYRRHRHAGGIGCSCC